jgi:hypothetical protein
VVTIAGCSRVVVTGVPGGEASFDASTTVARRLFDAPVGATVEYNGQRFVVVDAWLDVEADEVEDPVCFKRLAPVGARRSRP